MSVEIKLFVIKVKTILVLLLYNQSQCFAQEWEHVARNPDINLYIKTGSGEQIGDIIRVWTLVDYRRSEIIISGNQKVHARSIVGLEEYDCKGSKVHAITRRVYSSGMGKGKILLAEDDTGWKSIDKGSIVDGMRNEVCR